MVSLPSTICGGVECLSQQTVSVTRATGLRSKKTSGEPVMILPLLVAILEPMPFMMLPTILPRESPAEPRGADQDRSGKAPDPTVAATAAATRAPTTTPRLPPNSPPMAPPKG